MDKLREFEDLLKAFNWHTPSWDLFIILFWLVASVIYSFSAGKGRLLSILVSVYMAKLLVLEAPFISTLVNQKLDIVTQSLQQLATFTVLFFILFFSLSKYGFRTTAEGRGAGSFVFGTIFSVLQVGLLLNIVMGFLPHTVREGFSPLVSLLFIGSTANFVWLVLPIAFLVILGKFVSHRAEL